MDYVRLGQSGLKVSRIALGTMTYGDPGWRDWVLDEDASRPFIARAVELGINFFDTADMYSLGRSEEVLGRALRLFTSRDQAIIATKVYNPMGSGPNDRGLSRKHIMDAVQASLKRLGTDYIDLYQIHRFDPETPILETMTALHDLVRMGAVRYIGASSMLAYQFAKMQHAADLHGLTRFVSMQNHYNLVYREEEREMMPLCREDGVGVIPWSPLARGFLAGNRSEQEPKTTRARSDTFGQRLYRTRGDYAVQTRVAEVAQRLGVFPAQVATAWLLAQPGVSAPIVGASKMPHLEDAVAALKVNLSAEDCAALEAPYEPHPVLGI
ncbi:aldo/keto reductase [Deinococcus deserti]|uniref:Putative aryl-alcohol dehydrogenase (NADP(+)) n=1 Tax=Deinococcus deserti (strain DSM 17065 / CIP 109153 / LMG 22923 / VCD115) TaxID=546414 RepID=C1D2L2_DEIDV|nr:aldo/keto reductase [Deinococcus deserti]ACO47651.1 putative aryl-alcohol dehydrogenase (NADP(+)) [Deinococcus deserti VCD115]